MRFPKLLVALALVVLPGLSSFSAQPKAPPIKPNEVVYITRTGKKFHRAGCGSLRSSSFPMSRSEAIAKGYKPCQICKP